MLGWSAVKYAVKKLPETVEGIRQSVDDLRRDETGSVRGGVATKPDTVFGCSNVDASNMLAIHTNLIRLCN